MQLIADAGHAPHQEAPGEFTGLLAAPVFAALSWLAERRRRS